MLFVDFKQAFDSIDRTKIYKVFEELGIHKKIIRLALMTLNGTKTRVLIQGTVTEDSMIGSGVRQGDELSTTIFNILLHYAMGDLYKGGYIINKSYQILAYCR